MNAPKCAVASLLRIDNLLRSGGLPANISVLCSSASVARTFQHLVDLQTPIGNYDMTISADWVVARNILLAADSLHMEIPRYPLNHIASAALLRRVLSQISGNRYKPPNDPNKYFRQLQDILWTLRYHGISAGQLKEAATAGLTEHPTKVSDLQEIYDAWIEHKEALNVFDASDYMYHALSAGSELQLSPHGIQHLVAPDAHLLSWPALQLIDGLFGQVSVASGGIVPPEAFTKEIGIATPTVDLYFDGVLLGHPKSGYLRAVEISKRSDNLARWHVHEEAESVHSPQTQVVSAVGGVLGVQPAEASACESQVVAAPSGFAYHQQIAVPGLNSHEAYSLSAMGIANKSEPVQALLQLFRSFADASRFSPLRNSRTVAIICRSPAQAREMYTELQDAVQVDTVLKDRYHVHYDSVIYMRDIDEVRLLLAVITVLANPHDDQALFHVFTSNVFGVTHAEMQQVLHLHRLRDSPQAVWTFISELVPPMLPAAHEQRENETFAAESLVSFGDSSGTSSDVPSDLAGPVFVASLQLARAVRTLQQTQRQYRSTSKVGVALRGLIRMTGLEKQLNAPTSLQDEMRATAVASVLRMVADAESGQVSPDLLWLNKSTQTMSNASARHQPILGAHFVLGVLSDFIIENALPLRHEIHHHSTAVTDLDEISTFHAPGGTGTEPPDDATLLTVADVVDGPTIAAITERAYQTRQGLSHQGSIKPLHRDSDLVHVVVTTERRALQHRFDCVVIPWASDSTMPGSMSSQEFSFLYKLFPTWRQVSPFTRESHVTLKKWTLMQLLLQSTHGGVFITPPTASTATSTSNRRSRFLDAIFGSATPPGQEAKSTAPNAEAHRSEPGSTPLLLSYTRLHEYMWCPHRYYLRRIINLEPPGTPAMLYGRALHAAVARCTQLLQEFLASQLGIESFAGLTPCERLGALTTAVTLPCVSATRSKLRAAAGSLPTKSLLVVEMQREFNSCWKGRQANSPGREDTIDDIGRYDLVHVPVGQAADLEKEARLAIDRYAEAELICLKQQIQQDGTITLPLLVETSFGAVLGSTDSLTRGVIDRVDAQFDDTGLVGCTIIEYKSSLQWKQAAALESRRRDKLQTSLYQLALPKLLGTPSGVPVSAEIRSIEANDILQMTASPAVLKTTAAKVDDISRRISQNAFPALPSQSRCSMCSFARSCAHAHGVLRSKSAAKVGTETPV